MPKLHFTFQISFLISFIFDFCWLEIICIICGLKKNRISKYLDSADDNGVSWIKVRDHFAGDTLDFQTNVSAWPVPFVLDASGLVHSLEDASVKLEKQNLFLFDEKGQIKKKKMKLKGLAKDCFSELIQKPQNNGLFLI